MPASSERKLPPTAGAAMAAGLSSASSGELNLRAFALVSLARLIFQHHEEQPQGAEEQLLYEQWARLSRPRDNTGASNDWQAMWQRYLRAPAETDRPLLTLAKQLELSHAELLAVALALGVEDDPWVGRSVAYVQAPLGGSRPTMGLLDAAFTPILAPSAANGVGRERSVAAKIATGTAVRSGLLQRLNDSAPLPEQIIKVPAALALALRGETLDWPGTESEQSVALLPLPESFINTARQHAESLEHSPHRVLALRVATPAEGRSLARELAHALERRAVFINAEKTELAGLGPLCLIQKLIPVFEYELAPGENRSVPLLTGYDGPRLVILGADGSLETAQGTLLSWQVTPPPREERQMLWLSQLGEPILAERLAREHMHGLGRINTLAALARRQAEMQGRTAPNSEDVRLAAWSGEAGGLGALAQPLPARVEDTALVVPATVRDELNLLMQRCRRRDGLADKLGGTAQVRYQPGVRALFVGSSGTGKTLAAGWLATRLGLPLYRVDLAAVTSKYIGETEKNLSRLFSRAEHAEVVLLFDEADSLFGKRTEIKDSNDRFANAQTNYLLQRIESYNGIVVLTSNSRARFDSAFARRIDIMIDFPAPGPEDRRDLWRAHLGHWHNLTNNELNKLAASADLTGGHIRNAVLTAAAIAIDEDRVVGYSDIVLGLHQEYRKLGKKLPVELQ